jgi:multicomponent Na+:H+ antiporter subunit G
MPSLTTMLAAVLLVSGSALLLIAAVGLVRMPDVFLRMSATSKASSLGAGCVLGAAAVSAGDLGTAARAIACVGFLLATAPVAAHMIGRAAYLSGAPLWEGTQYDELRGHYNALTGTLEGEPAGSPLRTSDGGDG